jgi:hypothetical protein
MRQYSRGRPHVSQKHQALRGSSGGEVVRGIVLAPHARLAGEPLPPAIAPSGLRDDRRSGAVGQQLGDRGGQQHRGRVGIERPAGAMRKVLHELLAALVPPDVDHIDRHRELLGLARRQVALLSQPVRDDHELHRAGVGLARLL